MAFYEQEEGPNMTVQTFTKGTLSLACIVTLGLGVSTLATLTGPATASAPTCTTAKGCPASFRTTAATVKGDSDPGIRTA